MPLEHDTSTSKAKASTMDKKSGSTKLEEKSKRPAFLWLALFVLLAHSTWVIHRVQFGSLPLPLTAEQAGKRGFSEASALEHVKYLTSLGPHPVGSDAVDLALQYVLAASEKIKKTAHWEVDVQVDHFHAKIGANRLSGGSFKGKTLIYSDLKHVVLRILPKYRPEAEENLLLISSHVDTVFSTEGAGDCSSCVGVMLELARGVSQWAHGFKNGVIFLFNTGEEEGLTGAHSFMTQHPWSSAVRFAVDLEAIGIGGKSGIFQSGPTPWAIETFARVAKYPTGQITSQDLFLSGAIKGATDFQVYQELAGLSGLDFAYMDATAVYHTKNDKMKLLKPGSLQHLGENMLAFLLQTVMSPHLAKDTTVPIDASQTHTIFFDILGMYMVVYRQSLASMIHNSVILQALLIWTTSLLMGGYSGAISFGLSCLSLVLMWIFSLSFSIVVALVLPFVCSFPMPYIANPWLVVGLFGAPAVLGALAGQHVGFHFLQKHLQKNFSQRGPKLSPDIQVNLVNWESERWLFKAGFVQSFILLIIGNFYKVGSTYIALVWLVSPAFAYGLMEATLTPARSPKKLKIVTLIFGLATPVLISAGGLIHLAGNLIGTNVRLDRNPGSAPEWLGNLIVAMFVASAVCLLLVYLLSYFHLSGAKGMIVFSIFALFALTLAAVSLEIFPTYTHDTARTVNVVHVVETTGAYNEDQNPQSYVSLFSHTPGKLAEEVKSLVDEKFNCGQNRTLDLVTFTVRYNCWSSKDTNTGWSHAEIPILHVEKDSVTNVRKTRVLIDTKVSTRWALAINTQEINDFTFEVDSEEVVPEGGKSTVDGWHIIQYSGGQDSPTKFHLNLSWLRNITDQSQRTHKQAEGSPLLLKLRTDVNRITPKTGRVLEKLPFWCALFGKSTSPYTLAFLTSLPVHF